MDNRSISIMSEGKNDFDLSMKLAINQNKTIGYRVHENKLILYWAKSDKMEKLLYEMNIDETINFVWGWLNKNKPSGNEPDHDGDNGIGFHIFNESWGHVFGEWQAFIAIEPIWAIYGK